MFSALYKYVIEFMSGATATLSTTTTIEQTAVTNEPTTNEPTTHFTSIETPTTGTTFAPFTSAEAIKLFEQIEKRNTAPPSNVAMMRTAINRGTQKAMTEKKDSIKAEFIPPTVAALHSAVQQGTEMANKDNNERKGVAKRKTWKNRMRENQMKKRRTTNHNKDSDSDYVDTENVILMFQRMEREDKKRTASLKNDNDYDYNDEDKVERNNKKHKASIKIDNSDYSDDTDESSEVLTDDRYQANIKSTLEDKDRLDDANGIKQTLEEREEATETNQDLSDRLAQANPNEQELEERMQEMLTDNSTAEAIVTANRIVEDYVTEKYEEALTMAGTIAASIPEGASDKAVMIHIGDSIYNYGNTLRPNGVGNFVYLPTKIEMIKTICRVTLSSLKTDHDIDIEEDEIEAILNNHDDYLSPYVLSKKISRNIKRLNRLARVEKGFRYA